METLTVKIGFDYNNGHPVWNVPDKVTVNHGLTEMITWTFDDENVVVPPEKAIRFSLVNPIQFVTDKAGITKQDGWGGGAPVRVGDWTVTVVDDNTAPGVTKDYYYSISVDVFGDGMVGEDPSVETFTKDPEVENPGA